MVLQLFFYFNVMDSKDGNNVMNSRDMVRKKEGKIQSNLGRSIQTLERDLFSRFEIPICNKFFNKNSASRIAG